MFPHMMYDVILGVVDIFTPHVSAYESIMIYTLHVLLMCVFLYIKLKVGFIFNIQTFCLHIFV